ncbi:hypothetical protein [Streptomyces tsukubensis]|uniref:hypothetical protein n=1 Tax=Streptomyces tsukubensis TaxID=83656 RepID=UPI00344DDE1B
MGAEIDRVSRAAAAVAVDPQELPTLRIDALVQQSQQELIARAVANAEEHERIQGTATQLLQNTAAVLVALRIQMDDLRGKSYEYRQLVGDIYRTAGVEPGSSTRDAVRYHVGNLLRKALTPRQLESAGLLPASPLERNQDARAATGVLVQALRTAEAAKQPPARPTTSKGRKTASQPSPEAGQAVKATADTLRLATAAASVVGQISPDVIKEHMTDGQREELDRRLAAMIDTLTELRSHTKKTRSAAKSPRSSAPVGRRPRPRKDAKTQT